MTSSNPWLGRRVLSYAHQGGAWEAPSSTLFAVRRAIELGATGIELDVHATADRQLVVCHDATVDRTTDGHGPIHSLTLKELRELDNAHWFVPGSGEHQGLPPGAYPFRGLAPGNEDFCVATLEEVLDVMDEYPTVALNLDIKATAPVVEPYEELLANALRSHGGLDRVIVASFLDAATEAFKKVCPEVATSAGTLAAAAVWAAVNHGAEAPVVRYQALQVPATRGGRVLVDDKLVKAAHEWGMAVHLWTINDEDEMQRLLDLGVDGIITDLPTPLVGVLEERHLTYTA
jgi:glycerophosphoryl diester phosphodiesterase